MKMEERRENQRVRLTKRLLRESLLTCMQEKPLERISVKELCERAGVNRSTFYLHYDTQNDLMREMEDDAILQTQKQLQNVSPDIGTMRCIAAFLQYVRENGVLFRALLCQPGRDSFRSRFIAESLAYVKPGIMLEPGEPLSDYIYAFLLNGSLAVIQSWAASGFLLPAEQIAGLIFRLSDRSLAGYR